MRRKHELRLARDLDIKFHTEVFINTFTNIFTKIVTNLIRNIFNQIFTKGYNKTLLLRN